jgi:hypothetical protein
MKTPAVQTEERYLDTLRRMTPEQRLLKAMELTEECRDLYLAGFRSRYPGLSEAEVKRLAVAQLIRWRSSTSF